MEARKIFATLGLQMLLVSSYITNVCDHSRNTEKQLLKKSFLYFSHSPATFHLQIQRFCASDGSIVFAWLWLHAGPKKKKLKTKLPWGGGKQQVRYGRTSVERCMLITF